MKTYLYLFLLFFSLTCFAQNEDKIWLFGYGGWSGNPSFGDVLLDFNDGDAELVNEERDLNLDLANASICDKDGNLLFYTNGVEIYNGSHDLVENGDKINSGSYIGLDSEDGYRSPQSAFFLKAPLDDSIIHLFHVPRQLIEKSNESYVAGVGLLYSVLKKKANGANWKVIEKNIPLIEDELISGHLTTVKHANGRDFWILIQKYNLNSFYKVLISPNDIQVFPNRLVTPRQIKSGLGQAVFSPDGSKFVLNNGTNRNLPSDLDIFDFDRCTGKLSNQIHFTYGDTSWAEGAAISPNSKFLYISNDTKLFQYDLESNDIQSSEILIGEYDGFLAPFQTRFFMAQLAPDGKIYINTMGSNNVLHVIHEPNKRGLDCRFEQHAIELGVLNKTLPNFPNYGLGALEGSLCDTLSTTSTNNNFEVSSNINVLPNPTSNAFQIYLPDSKGVSVQLFNASGRLVLEETNVRSGEEVSISHLPKGMYFYQFRSEKREVIHAGKLVVIR